MKKNKFTYETDPRWKKVKQLCKQSRYDEANEIILQMQKEYNLNRKTKKYIGRIDHTKIIKKYLFEFGSKTSLLK